jgi:hypothetical protein
MDPEREDEPRHAELPPSLERALVETAEYALRLRTGELVRFTRAERRGSFVVLYAAGVAEAGVPAAGPLPAFPHGLEVRIRDIVWCARGPMPAYQPEAPSVGPAADFRDMAGDRPGVRVPLRIKREDQ